MVYRLPNSTSQLSTSLTHWSQPQTVDTLTSSLKSRQDRLGVQNLFRLQPTTPKRCLSNVNLKQECHISKESLESVSNNGSFNSNRDHEGIDQDTLRPVSRVDESISTRHSEREKRTIGKRNNVIGILDHVTGENSGEIILEPNEICRAPSVRHKRHEDCNKIKRKVVPITPLPRIQTVERVMSDIESIRDGSQIEKKSANVFERNDTVDNFGELGIMMRCASLVSHDQT